MEKSRGRVAHVRNLHLAVIDAVIHRLRAEMQENGDDASVLDDASRAGLRQLWEAKLEASNTFDVGGASGLVTHVAGQALLAPHHRAPRAPPRPRPPSPPGTTHRAPAGSMALVSSSGEPRGAYLYACDREAFTEEPEAAGMPPAFMVRSL